MSRTGCLKSWYKSCGAIALAAVFALNSTSAWAANQTIAAGQTVSGAVGTSSNDLSIYGTIIDAVISGGDDHDVYNGGVANNTVINRGRLSVSNGGTANTTVVNDGILNVDGRANNTIVKGGKIIGSSGSIVDGLTINENGAFSFNTGMTLTNATIYGEDKSIVDNVAKGFVLNNGSSLYVSKGGTANDTIVNDGGLTVSYDGTANNTTVNGGNLNVYSGGVANTTTVNGGKILAYSGSTIDGLRVDKEGSFSFNTGMTLTNATLYGKEASIVDNVASGLTLDNSSRLTVNSDGTANNTTVNGGELTVNSGGMAENTTLKGGYIINDGNIKNIILDIDNNIAELINDGAINEITGKVHNGEFSFDSTSATTLKNTSFKNSSLNLSGNINIVADNGVSEFRGNNEVYLSGDGSLIAQNNGKIVFDDVVNGSSKIGLLNFATSDGSIVDEENQVIAVGYSQTYISENDYLKMIADAELYPEVRFNEDKTAFTLYDPSAAIYEYAKFVKQDDGFYNATAGYLFNYEVVDGDYLVTAQIQKDDTLYSYEQVQEEKEYYNQLIASDPSINSEWKDQNTFFAIIPNDGQNVFQKIKFIPQEDGTYRRELSAGFAFLGLSFNIAGDDSGEVHFNEQVLAKNITLSDTNVFFGKNSKIKDYSFIANSGSVNNAVIESGGELILEAASKAKDTVVELGGKLVAKAAAVVENMTAKAQSILEVDQDAVLKGDIVIDKEADISGSSYDFSKIFSNANLDIDSLTVVGGVHEAFTDTLVNETSQDKGLTLEGGEYSLANVIKEGSTQVAGWDVINIKATESAPATIVKLETDIELVGSNKEMSIGEGAVLDVSGHSPLEITIDGNVTNSGTMDFTIYDNDGEADDIVTIAGDYRAAPGALIVLNVEPEKDKADKMVVQGDVIGNTNVFLKSNSEKEPTAEILFAEVANDDEATASGFDIWRVEGSPFEWDTKKEEDKWYTYIASQGSVAPEMIAYMGLYDAGFEQTASLNRVIAENVGKNQLLGKGCRGTLCREINPVRNAWVAPVHQNLDIDAPYKYEAKISGLDAGIDINSDGINKWGVLASYRKGNYEFDGQGDKYYSDEGSEIDIDSYAMGLYFRRDKYNSKFAGTIYAGMQKAEISSDNGAKAKTDALEVGASLDVSHIFEITKDITIAPELQISYQMLDYDNIKDNAGKKVQLESAHRITAEAGAKLEKKWTLDEGKAAIYVKPSVIQTIHGGGKLNVKALDSIHTTEDRTLGRFEIGAEYEVNTRWSVGASAAHTFGSDYKDTTFSLDAKYRF